MRSHPSVPRRTLVVAIAVASVTSLPAARAETLEELTARVQALTTQIIELERQQRESERRQASAPQAAVTAGATPGSFKLPGSNTSVTLGGYVKLDATYSNPSAGVDSAADLFLQPNAIAVGPAARDNERRQVKFGARESRLFARTSTPTSWGELTTYVEGDFYGADGNESVSNSSGLRLRHAYGSLGPLLAGQTWTNFMYVPALPETLDFGGPVGQIFARQAQVRWTKPFGDADSSTRGQWSVALENPESVFAAPGAPGFRADDDRFPDLTGQLVLDTAKGKVAVSGVLRQIRADARSPAVVDQAWGGAINVSGVMPLNGQDDLRFTVAAGNGIGRYSDGFFADGVVGTDGRIRLPREWAWYAAYRHFWTEQLRSSVVLSSAQESNPADTPASTNRSTRSAHLNLIWSPVANTDLGLEYIHASRKTEDGLTGQLGRLQASARYRF